MNTETLDKLENILNQLAAGLGTTTEFLMEVLIKQAYVFGTVELIKFSIFIFLLLIATRAIAAWIDEAPEKAPEPAPEKAPELTKSTLRTIQFFIILLSMYPLIPYLLSIFTAFINPEYWALNHILEKL